MEKMTSWASFIHKDVLGEKKKSYKSQTGEIVPVLTGTDLLPSPQGHKVSLLMHAVKGNLANTVCKRKHQHIASVLVLGSPCMLFSNFDSFLWGQGVWGGWWIFFPLPPLPSVTLTQSQGEVASVTGPCAFWPMKPSQTMCQTMGPCSRTNVYIHLQLCGTSGDIQRVTARVVLWENRPTNISVDLII